ncbi:MAG: sigma 54-interacting transcriptional regulator, partial [Vicinamibacteria bacterium]
MASFPWYEADSTLDEGIESISIGFANLHCTVPDAGSFCEKALEEISRSLASVAARVVLLSDDGSRIETMAEQGRWHAVCADGLRTSLVVRLVEKDSDMETAALPEGSSEIAVPLRHDGRIFGVLQIAAALQGGARERIASLMAFAARLLSTYLSSRLKLETRWSELDDIQREMDAGAFRSDIVGRSASLASVIERVKQVAPTDVTVLIEGENGTGKELIARAIHGESRRADKPWVVVNCAAIPSELLESELFGHERGSFTGAYRDRVGVLEMAHRGTVFMDEIGETSPRMQSLLLRFLESGEIQRVG